MCARISVDIESMSKETHRSMEILGASENQNPDAKKRGGIRAKREEQYIVHRVDSILRTMKVE